MSPVVGLAAVGDMGGWIARRLTSHGVRVVTAGAGRSEASIARAVSANVEVMTDRAEVLRSCHIFFSIVPPSVALEVAEEVAETLRSIEQKPLFFDLNAVASPSVMKMEECLRSIGCDLVDGCILGKAPADTRDGPRIFACGPRVAIVEELSPLALNVTSLGLNTGSASALKCSYAAIGKGVTAVAIEAILAATRSGAGEQLHAELTAHMPELMRAFEMILPDSFERAGRWVGEMHEIANEFRAVPGGSATFRAAADLYENMSGQCADTKHERSIQRIVSQFLHPRDK